MQRLKKCVCVGHTPPVAVRSMTLPGGIKMSVAAGGRGLPEVLGSRGDCPKSFASELEVYVLGWTAKFTHLKGSCTPSQPVHF